MPVAVVDSVYEDVFSQLWWLRVVFMMTLLCRNFRVVVVESAFDRHEECKYFLSLVLLMLLSATDDIDLETSSQS